MTVPEPTAVTTAPGARPAPVMAIPTLNGMGGVPVIVVPGVTAVTSALLM